MTTIFEGFDQFINWIPRPKANGKTDKIPIGTTGYEINPHDKNNWMSEESARQIAKTKGHSVGFVFTENDPFFFVDIDDAVIDGDWSNLAKTIMSAFPGCAMEVSHSQKALHIFGTGRPGTHRCKNKEYNIEFYTEKRFVALTGNSQLGNSLTDGTPGLRWLIETYFKPDTPGIIAEWTDKPCSDWNGETDDEALILRAKRDRRPSAVFGNKATFGQLFKADARKLVEFFPSDSGYNASMADLALCSHLAYWTGKDCDRMERLFNLSGLAVRDKWQDREAYRYNTILKAVSGCQKVYTRADPIGKLVSTVKPRVGSQLMDLRTQLDHFKGCVYVINRHRIFVPGMGLMKPDVFKAVYGGYDFSIRFEGKASKNSFETFTESQLYDFPVAYGTVFRPEKPPGSIILEEKIKYVNTYIPVEVESKRGDASPFLGLLKKILPNDNDRQILLSYMAACVQYPGEKFQWAPVLQGTEGNGKTFLGTSVAKAVGEKYSHIQAPEDINNGWIEEKLFVVIEEIFTKDVDIREALKPLITNRRIGIQHKGADQITGDNRANFMLFCNRKGAVLKTKRDRRYCVFFSAQQEIEDLSRDGMHGNYFPQLYDWARTGGYAIITDYLIGYRIDSKFNPTTECHRAPETSSTHEALILSLEGIEQEIIEAVEEEMIGFRGGWISSVALKQLLKENGRKVAPNKRKELLLNLGYHKKGRMNRGSIIDGAKKPTLYVREHLLTLNPGVETEIAYLNAQGIEPLIR